MKNKIYTTFIHLGALLMLLPAIVSSCLYEEPELTADGTKGVDPTQVNIMSEVTLDMNLAPLEINNTRAATTSGYNYRFTVIAYEGKEEVARQEIYEAVRPEQSSVSLPISMKLHARKYQLVVWADYIRNQEGNYTLFYDTGNMERILRAGSYKGNSNYYDAFYGTAALNLTPYRDQWNVIVPIDIQMVRPLARYELIATDVDKFLKKIKDKEITGNQFTISIKYGYYLTTGFNALTGQVKHPLQYVSYSKSIPLPTEGTEELPIGFDYVFVNGEGSFVSLTIEITNEKSNVVARYRNLKVPYKQNHLTTVRGKFLSANPGIDIDTDFDDDIIVDLDRL